MESIKTTQSKLSIICGWILIVTVVLAGCGEDDPNFPADSLASYIQTSGLPVQEDSLIACAISAKSNSGQSNPDFPIEVIFYPLNEISDIRYYESSETIQSVGDYSLLKRKTLSTQPMFNGYLQKFLHPGVEEKLIGVVTYIRNNKLFISDGIHVQTDSNPTEYDDNLISITQTSALSPLFSWSDGTKTDNVIYFQVLADDAQNLISGTYTLDNQFQFYNLENVVLNIRDIDPSPSLQLGATYNFWVFGVNADNWVNFIAQKQFIAQ